MKWVVLWLLLPLFVPLVWIGFGVVSVIGMGMVSLWRVVWRRRREPGNDAFRQV
jgi:hypothetical protein